MVSIVLGSTPFIDRANSARDFSEASPESVVSDLVAELAILYEFVGLPSRSCDLTSLSSARRNCCWSPIRPRSLPSPMPCRVRTYASDWVPSSLCGPAVRSRPDDVSRMSCGTSTVTPPMASTRSLNPAKLISR